MLAEDEEVDKVYYKLTEDDGKLVPRHEGASHVGGCHLGDIHGADGRGQTHTDAAEYTVYVKHYEQRSRGLAILEEQKFRIIAADGRKEKEDAGDGE